MVMVSNHRIVRSRMNLGPLKLSLLPVSFRPGPPLRYYQHARRNWIGTTAEYQGVSSWRCRSGDGQRCKNTWMEPMVGTSILRDVAAPRSRSRREEEEGRGHPFRGSALPHWKSYLPLVEWDQISSLLRPRRSSATLCSLFPLAAGSSFPQTRQTCAPTPQREDDSCCSFVPLFSKAGPFTRRSFSRPRCGIERFLAFIRAHSWISKILQLWQFRDYFGVRRGISWTHGIVSISFWRYFNLLTYIIYILYNIYTLYIYIYTQYRY